MKSTVLENKDLAVCPECGASKVTGYTCWDMLGQVIGWEYGDPELASEHFMTVACYNIQHPAQFKDEVISDLKQLLAEYLEKKMTVKQIREYVSSRTEGKVKILKEKNEVTPVLKKWEMTIADIYTDPKPENPAEKVRQWGNLINLEIKNSNLSIKKQLKNKSKESMKKVLKNSTAVTEFKTDKEIYNIIDQVIDHDRKNKR
jgi:hypothetical protein